MAGPCCRGSSSRSRSWRRINKNTFQARTQRVQRGFFHSLAPLPISLRLCVGSIREWRDPGSERILENPWHDILGLFTGERNRVGDSQMASVTTATAIEVPTALTAISAPEPPGDDV